MNSNQLKFLGIVFFLNIINSCCCQISSERGFYKIHDSNGYYEGYQPRGLFKSYSLDSKLTSIGWSDNGEYVNWWYFFNQDGSLWYSVTDIDTNTNILILDEGTNKWVKKEKKGIISYFALDGSVQKQGPIVFDHNFEINYWEYGQWFETDVKGITKTLYFEYKVIGGSQEK